MQARKEEEQLLSQTREQTQAIVRQAREDLRRLINEFKAKGRTDLHRLGQEIQAEEEKISQGVRKKSEEDLSLEATGIRPEQGSPPATLAQLKETFGLKSGKGKKAARTDKPGFIDYQIPSANPEIKVIGLRVEEAIPLVDKAVDEAFLGGLKELEIIHGAGTGRLRQAIRDHLQEHPLVKTFVPGGPGRGGNGVTVVEISPSPSTKSAHRHSSKMGAERG
jgi:DNA mismatch repair protein MutS2